MADCTGLIFPPDISYGSKGGPVYNTSIVVRKSGIESRNANWTYPLHAYEAAYGVKTAQQMNAVLAFYHQHYGRWLSFLFKDWNDFTAETYHGATLVSQGRIGAKSSDPPGTKRLVKRYITGALDRSRFITRPKIDTIQCYLASVAVARTVDPETGIVTGGDVDAWTGEFYVRCRFDTDTLAIDAMDRTGADLVVNTSIPIIEERE